jgi:hypothetical protein
MQLTAESMGAYRASAQAVCGNAACTREATVGATAGGLRCDYAYDVPHDSSCLACADLQGLAAQQGVPLGTAAPTTSSSKVARRSNHVPQDQGLQNRRIGSKQEPYHLGPAGLKLSNLSEIGATIAPSALCIVHRKFKLRSPSNSKTLRELPSPLRRLGLPLDQLALERYLLGLIVLNFGRVTKRNELRRHRKRGGIPVLP